MKPIIALKNAWKLHTKYVFTGKAWVPQTIFTDYVKA
jgi:hypothetical protein